MPFSDSNSLSLIPQTVSLLGLSLKAVVDGQVSAVTMCLVVYLSSISVIQTTPASRLWLVNLVLKLSLNDFRGTPIPSFLGSMSSLTYLNLWGASFGGLRQLYLGGNSGLYVDNFSWISLLSSLESFDGLD